MLVGKEQPVICVLDLVSGDVTIVEDERLADVSSGQVSSYIVLIITKIVPAQIYEFMIYAIWKDITALRV